MQTQQERLAALIRTARASKGWTQEELAQQMGIKRQTLAAYESARNWPQARQAHLLRTILGIDVPDKADDRPVTGPSRVHPEDARGVRYAALEMSRTLTRLLEEASEAERTEDYQRRAELAARAIATHKAAPPATAKGSSTPARRPRRAQG